MIVLGIKSYTNAVGGAKGDVLNDPEGMKTSWDLGVAVTKLAQRLEKYSFFPYNNYLL